ncbi:MAG: site-specific integrase [Clostridia bacterium]|nr:site-specific integrase [Clostridia bacterium]MCI9085638.1 site-specific integrase [Clostridia bacterium]
MASIKKIEGKRGTSYKITVSDGYHVNGNKIRRTKTFVPDPTKTEKQNQKELEKIAFEFEQQVKQGRYYDGDHMTLEEFSKKWFREYVDVNLTPVTQELYRRLYKSYISPHLGHYKISKLSPLKIQELWAHLQNDNVRKDGKDGGLSGTTVKKIHVVLSKMLTCAVRWQLISSNPCERIDRPKPERNIEDINFFTPEEAVIFLASLDISYPRIHHEHTRTDDTGKEYKVKDYIEHYTVPLQFKVMYNIALFGGLRRGELLGLTFDSFNFDKSTVSITQSVSKTQTGIVIKKPKTRTSFRIVTLPSFVMELVKDLKQEQSEKTKTLGTYWKNDEGYLFTQENGSLMHPSTPTITFKNILTKYNNYIENNKELLAEEREIQKLPMITLHGLRHTSATLAISQNVDVKTVSARLGHAQTSTTLNIYAHALSGRDTVACDAIEQAIYEAKKSNSH